MLWATMVFFGGGLLLPLRPLRQRLMLALASVWGIEVLKLGRRLGLWSYATPSSVI
jgi:hypothetical protein